MNQTESLAPTDDTLPAPRAFVHGIRRTFAAALRSQGLLSVVDQGVVSGASFLTSVIIGRALGQENLGVYSLALSVLLFARGVQGDLISAPYMMYCNRRRGKDLATYSGSSLIHELAFLAVSVVVLLSVMACFWLRSGPTVLTTVMLALSGALPFLLLREFMRLFSFSHLRMRPALATDVLIAVIQIGALASFARLHILTVEAAFISMVAACAIACGGWFLVERHPLQFGREPIVAHWRENWSFSRWALAGQLVNRGAGYLTPWIVALAHGDAATGALAACTVLVNLAGTFVAGVANFVTPRGAKAFAGGGVDELLRVLARTTAVFVVVIGTFCLVIWQFGDPLLQLIYGNHYTGLGLVLTVLAVGTLANSLGFVAGTGLWAIDRPGSNFAADVAMLIVSVGLLAALIGPLGVLGAALASCGGSFAGAAIRWFVLSKLIAEIRRRPQLQASNR